MPVLAVIPARLGATRLPRKPLRLLGGKPLVVRVAEQVASLGLVDHLVVATDSADVVDACRAHGIDVTVTSPAHASGTDRVAEVARRAEFAQYPALLNVQGDEPFITHEAIVGALRMVLDNHAPIGTAAALAGPDVLQRADIVKVVTDDSDRALYFSRAPIPFLRDGADEAVRNRYIRQHIGVYAFQRDALMRFVALPPHPLELIERLEQLRALAHGIPIGVSTVTAAPASGIDTEEDLVFANERFVSLTAAPRT